MLTPEQWYKHFEDCERAGETPYRYAKRLHLRSSTFYYWRKRWLAQRQAGVALSRSDFVQLVPPPSSVRDSAVLITLTNGTTLRCSDALSASWLVGLVRGLAGQE